MSKVALEEEKLGLEIWKLSKEKDLIEKSARAQGEFTYFGPVVEKRVHEFIDTLDTWSRNHVGADITILINSQGGVVIDGFALYDFIQELKQRGHYITTKGLGLQASMGGILMQAGDNRVMTKHSWMMLHEVQGVADGSFSDMKNVIDFNRRLQEQGLDILAERSTLTKTKLRNRWKEDMWLDASDALKLGFIDSIQED